MPTPASQDANDSARRCSISSTHSGILSALSFGAPDADGVVIDFISATTTSAATAALAAPQRPVSPTENVSNDSVSLNIDVIRTAQYDKSLPVNAQPFASRALQAAETAAAAGVVPTAASAPASSASISKNSSLFEQSPISPVAGASTRANAAATAAVVSAAALLEKGEQNIASRQLTSSSASSPSNNIRVKKKRTRFVEHLWAFRTLVISCIILALGIVVGVGLFFAVETAERDNTQRDLDVLASVQQDKLAATFNSRLLTIASMKALLSVNSGTNITLAQYNTFANISQLASAASSGLYALDYAPIVKDTQRDVFETELRQLYGPYNPLYANYSILEIDPTINTSLVPQSTTVISRRKPWYTPVKYVYPLMPNKQALSFDLNCEDLRHASIVRAIETNTFSITGRLRLVQEKGIQFGALCFIPIYGQIQPQDPTGRTRDDLSDPRAVMAGVFRVGDVIDAASADSIRDIDVVVFDNGNGSYPVPPSERFLHSSIVAYLKNPTVEIEEDLKMRLASGKEALSVVDVNIADRIWQLWLIPKPIFLSAHVNGIKWVVLFGLIGVAIVMCLCIAFVSKWLDFKARVRKLNKQRIALLNRIMPKRVADRVAAGDTIIADMYSGISLCFLDITRFTDMCSECSPIAIVMFLNALFSELDELIESNGLDKIKTIGDAMFVASQPKERDANGNTVSDEEHAKKGALAIARFALEAVQVASTFTGMAPGQNIQIRVGCNIGNVVAGVIGRSKPLFDLWGSDVNIAARLESTSLPGQVHVSEAFCAAVSPQYKCISRGDVQIKGVGIMHTYFLVGPARGSAELSEQKSESPMAQCLELEEVAVPVEPAPGAPPAEPSPGHAPKESSPTKSDSSVTDESLTSTPEPQEQE